MGRGLASGAAIATETKATMRTAEKRISYSRRSRKSIGSRWSSSRVVEDVVFDFDFDELLEKRGSRQVFIYTSILQGERPPGLASRYRELP